MDRYKVFNAVIRINRILVGTVLITFGLSTGNEPLGSFAVFPLVGAAVILYGVLDWRSVPEVITSLIQKVGQKFTSTSISSRHLQLG